MRNRFALPARAALAILLAALAAAPLAAEDQLDAHKIMQAVNAKYQSILAQPREVTIEEVVTNTTMQRQDMTVESTHVAHLQGDKARFETISSRVRPSMLAVPGPTAAVTVRPRYSVWVHDGKETRALYEAVMPTAKGLQPVRRSFRIRHDQMPAGLPVKFRAPLTQNEFDPAFMNGKYYVFPSVWRGRVAYVIQSVAPIVLSDKSTVQSAQFWVDAEDLLLVRQEMVMQETLPSVDKGEPDYLVLSQDIVTTFNVTIDPSRFKLDLPEDAEDITPQVINAANAQMKKK